jgi:general stress protein 26
MMIKRYINKKGVDSCVVMFLLAMLPLKGNAQKSQSSIPTDTLIYAAREIIKANPYCALVTIDSAGQPRVRTMNPFPLSNEFVIWFATSRKSGKISEIKKNPKVCVYYADHTKAKGYVNITGTAVIIDDKELLIKMKRDYWEKIPNWQDRFVLIKVTPKTLDVINYSHRINGDSETSGAPSIVF